MERTNNEKLILFLANIGAIVAPYLVVQYQIYQGKQEIEGLTKRLASTIQQVASLKVDEGRLETIFSHIKYLTTQVKEQKQTIEYLTNSIKNQQKVFQDLVQQLELQGITYTPSRIRFEEVRRSEESDQSTDQSSEETETEEEEDREKERGREKERSKEKSRKKEKKGKDRDREKSREREKKDRKKRDSKLTDQNKNINLSDLGV